MTKILIRNLKFLTMILVVWSLFSGVRVFADGQNIILNPSLETEGTAGSPLNWTKISWGSPVATFKYPDIGRDGLGKSASVTLTKRSTGDARWAHDTVPVSAGDSYTYSSWYKSNIGTEVDAVFTDANGNLSYIWIADLPSSGNVWKQVSTTIKIPAGITKMTVFHLIIRAGTLTVDDFSLVKVGVVITPPPPPTLTFTASPESITRGSASTLSWSAGNLTSCTASLGWGGIKTLSGSENVSPTATTTYMLACTGSNGNISKQVTVGVMPPPPPTLSFSASPSTINQGSSSTISWNSTNATSCTALGGWTGNTATAGSQIVSPSATTTYAFSCTGPGGNISKQVVVAVIIPPKGPFTAGMVTLTFDDAWISQYTTVLPILQLAGIKATFYMTTDPIIGGWDDFMKPVQVQDIANKGHEIGDHTITHPHLIPLSAADITKEVTDSKIYLENLTKTKITTFAYPYGEFDANVLAILKNAGYLSARGVLDDQINIATSDKYNLFSSCVLKTYTFESIKFWIDQAKANNQWYIICIHEVKDNGTEYSLTPAQFQQIIDYIKSTGIKTVTIKEGTALMN